MKEFKNSFFKTIFALYIVFGLSTTTQAAFWDTKTKTANVVINNETGKNIESVTLVHKYSNVYKEEHTWIGLDNNQQTQEPMNIRYNIGALTTGVDWWFLTWKYKGDNKIYFTNPDNFRDVFDYIESIIIEELDKIAIGAEKVTGVKYTKEITQAIGNRLFNTEATVGFKRHLLRANDEKNGLLITIKQGTVKFASRSGNSSTEGINSHTIDKPEESIDNIEDSSVNGNIALNFNTNELIESTDLQAGVGLDGGYTNQISVTLNAPTDGSVHILATGTIQVLGKTNSSETRVLVGIANKSNGVPLRNHRTSFYRNATDGIGNYVLPYTTQGVFNVKAGLHTYYLVANGYGGSSEKLFWNLLTATFHSK